MAKINNESELVKKALSVGALYAEKRGYGKIEYQDSVKLKVECVYKVLSEDKLIQPLAKDQICYLNWHCGSLDNFLRVSLF